MEQRLTAPVPLPLKEDINQDLGFGARISQETRDRLLNQDGTFNVMRDGLPWWQALYPYHALLTMSWPRFYAVIIAGYLVANFVFAFAYLACGPGAMEGATAGTRLHHLREAYFFSVQTLATIGYGRISPVSVAANIVVTVEALVGLLGFSLATGLLFSRFSRPQAKLLFSDRAVVAPYRGGTAFMFRVANGRSNELAELEATVVFAYITSEEGRRVRRFATLALERQKVVFFPLHWVIVHPIDEHSPLYGLTAEQLREAEGEFLILIKALDETFSQTVHTRSSYRHEEVVWGARFRDMFRSGRAPRVGIDLRRIHEIETV